MRYKKSLIGATIVFVLGVGILGFLVYKNKISIMGFGSDKQSQGQEDSFVLVTTVPRKGKVSAPSYIKPETLLAVSLGDVSKVDSNGDINVPVYEKGVTAVAAMLPGKDFGFMHIVIGSEKPEITLETTAQAMVFMAPQLISSDPDISRSILEIIQKDDSVATLTKDLDRVLHAGNDPLKDEGFRANYGKAIESVLYTMNK